MSSTLGRDPRLPVRPQVAFGRPKVDGEGRADASEATRCADGTEGVPRFRHHASRRAQIIAAAIDTIAELGYDKASFARITERAGLSSPRLISYHFAGKDDLIQAIVEDVYRAGATYIVDRMKAGATASGRLKAYLTANLEFLRDHPKEIIALTELGSHLRNPSGERHTTAEYQEPGVQALAELLRDGQRSGEFREFDPRSMAVVIRGAVEAAASRASGPQALDMAIAPDEIAEAVEHILADRRTGQAWVAQAGQAAAPVAYPGVTLAGLGGSPAWTAPHQDGEPFGGDSVPTGMYASLMDTRERLIESTRELLWERGYVGTSPKAIQARAGAGQGSMYHHFQGKPDLARAAIVRSAAELRDRAESAFTGPGSVLDRVAAYLRRERDVLKGCPVGRLTQDPDVMADPGLRRPVEETFAWLTDRLAGLLTEGRANGELDAALDPRATAAALVAVLQGGYVLARAAGSPDMYAQAVDGALGLLAARTR
ncbi:TetR/AcrR family transcriptional regulator [Nonomuraea terrae]|nr:TetR/AcrR family transcriptional regulator [Nonomuraea terrae]